MLNKALKLLRVFNELSQTEMAQKLGVTKSWISEIESGRKSPTLNLLQGYADVLEVPISSILFFSEHLENGDAPERTRVFVSRKILAILDYIAARSGGDDEDDIEKEEELSA